MKFRAESGLPSDTATVTAAELSPTSLHKYGVALSPAEQADIDARVAVQAQLSPLVDALNPVPGFGGMYLDQKAHGIIDVATVGDTASLKDILGRHVPPGAKVRTRQVAYSLAELNALQQKVVSEQPGLKLGSVVDVSSVGVDVVNNRLRIGVASDLQQAADYFSKVDGPAIEVVAEARPTPASCTGRENCAPPAMGGLEIGLQNAGFGDGLCSSAYSARTPGGQVVLVTAGHCAGTHNRVVYNGLNPFNTRIGTIVGSTIWSNEPPGSGNVAADGAYATLATGMTGSNLVYQSPGSTNAIVTSTSWHSYNYGYYVCKEGRTSGRTCGIVTGTGYVDPLGSYTINNEVHTSVLSYPGDSGAAVFGYASGGLNLLGVDSEYIPSCHPDSCGGPMEFSPVDEVDRALGGLVPCIDGCGATYHPLNPARVLDSRFGIGFSGPLGNHAARTFQVTGQGGVPAGATAVTGNLTVTAQTSAGYLYIGPVAMNDPTSSTLNFPVNDNRANGVTVALGGGGTLSVTYVGSAGSTTHAIFDVTGYFTSDMTGATYHPVNSARLLDSRFGIGFSGPLGNHAARTFQVTGTGYVLAGATAVTGNLTVTAQTSAGYLYIGPVAMNDPTSSTLNFPVNDNRANGVTVALGGGGTLSVTYVGSAGSTTHAIFDVTGYFTSDMTGATYHPVNSARLLDSRFGIGFSGPLGNHAARTFQVTGTGGEPAPATGVTGNLTVTAQTSAGYLYIGPVATNNPSSSTLNFPVGDDRANGVSVAIGSGGTLSVTYVTDPGATAQAIFDVTGYYR